MSSRASAPYWMLYPSRGYIRSREEQYSGAPGGRKLRFISRGGQTVRRVSRLLENLYQSSFSPNCTCLEVVEVWVKVPATGEGGAGVGGAPTGAGVNTIRLGGF